MRKQESTNAQNEASILRNCGMAYTLSVIGGRWKPTILFSLLNGRMRYSELRRSISGISERMLVAQLRELEEDGLVQRIIYPEVPPRVEYTLTPAGVSAEPMLQCMSDWGNRLREKKSRRVARR
ncbi:transcriptional regulator [Chitinophaga alhagiae]|uniref:Transcriptional regulator n=1 Tax=Chitinophaga alhagiae TaxID=2203219 RepID=A0ABM6WDI0_9BACT|nr:helix-turn-helix domain-containing protein [Chitinophaga alhagiae]AWO02092.1 transcriptional regulator [Chitinophaga alhagiae]